MPNNTWVDERNPIAIQDSLHESEGTLPRLRGAKPNYYCCSQNSFKGFYRFHLNSSTHGILIFNHQRTFCVWKCSPRSQTRDFRISQSYDRDDADCRIEESSDSDEVIYSRPLQQIGFDFVCQVEIDLKNDIRVRKWDETAWRNWRGLCGCCVEGRGIKS